MNICRNELMYQTAFALDCVEQDLLGTATGHGKRVACVSMEIGRALGLTPELLSDLSACAVLHDNALTEYILEERNRNAIPVVTGPAGKKHCILGEKNARRFPFATDTEGFILYHHEEADGSGPFGKKQGEIPSGAAIIHLADQIDALFPMRSMTPDSLEQVKEHVTRFAGIRYDSKAAGAFLSACRMEWVERLRDDTIDASLKGYTACVQTRVPPEQLSGIGEVFAHIIDYKSPFTRRHSLGIAEKTGRMADFYGIAGQERAELTLAACLHDIGKLAVPLSILEKPGKLLPEEYLEIQKHVLYTWRMLNGVSGLEQVCGWASSHHEKLDGSGYPFHKKAEELDRNSRLLGCLDIYQALTEDRPYRSGMSHEEAIRLLREMALAQKIDGEITEDIGRVLA